MIWTATRGSSEVKMRSTRLLVAMSEASDVNRLMLRSGSKTVKTYPNAARETAVAMATRRLFLTRSNLCAPKLYPAMGWKPWIMPSIGRKMRDVNLFTIP